jgi:RecA-family ATPase
MNGELRQDDVDGLVLSPDLVKAVAIALLGPPTDQSNGTVLRFDAVQVKCSTGRFYDCSTEVGLDLIDFVASRRKCDRTAAIAWVQGLAGDGLEVGDAAGDVGPDDVDDDDGGDGDDGDDLDPDDAANADSDDGRDPACRQALGAAVNAMREAEGEHAQLLAIRSGAEALALFDDPDALDHLSEMAVNVYGLSPDAVTLVLGQGIETSRRRRADAAEAWVAPEFEPPAAANGKGREEPPVEVTPFDAFDASAWQGVAIEPERWLVADRIPAGEPGIMSGDGGTGKTTVLLQLAVSVALELSDWIGHLVDTHGPVIFYSAEERLKRMQRRVAQILEGRGHSFATLKGRLQFICELDDPALAKVDRDDVKPTLSMLRLEKTVAVIRPALVIIENAADVFLGNENDRASVTRFVRKHLGGLAAPSGATPVLIQHPSVSGIADGSGRSGTTAWSNAGRWRLNFTKIRSSGDDDDDADDGLRQLKVVKTNYGRPGLKTRLRWERGVFVPDMGASTTERAAAEEPIDEAFLRCLDAATAQGRAVGAKKSSTFAPAVFEMMPEANGLKSKALMMAMERHLSAGRIRVEESGPPSKRRERIVRSTVS